MISVSSSSPDARERVDDPPDPLVDRRAATRAGSGSCAGCRDLRRRSIGGSVWIAAGLSETSASLKFGGIGSGSSSKAAAWRGAGFGGRRRSSLGGCGFGFGPPECGAVYITPRKNGPSRSVAVDRVDREVGEHVLLEIGRTRLAVGDQRAVLVELVVVDALGAAAARPRTTRSSPAGRRSGRCAPVAVAVQVLADVDRPVAGRLQPDRQRAGVVEPGEAAVGRPVAEHAVVVRVLAGVERRPRRAAQRPVGEVVGERRPVGDELRARPSASSEATPASGRRSSRRRCWAAAVAGLAARRSPPGPPAATAATADRDAHARERHAPIAARKPQSGRRKSRLRLSRVERLDLRPRTCRRRRCA